MINKDSSKSVICLTCSDKATDGSEYCEACIKAGREKLGLEITDLFEHAETLRGSIDITADTLAGVH